MTITLRHIHRFPVKGLSPQALEDVVVTAGAGLPVDRLFAFAHARSKFNAAAPQPISKANYLMLMRNAKMAGLKATYSKDGHDLNLFQADTFLAAGRLDRTEDADMLAQVILDFMGTEETFGGVTLVSAPDQILSDVGRPAISLISLSTVAALSEAWGVEVDPVRFRGNFLFGGAAPWAEFDWIGKEITIGDVTLKVHQRTERCAATTVNPTTAERDLQVPKKLRQDFDHFDCGVYAEVLTDGTVSVGDVMIVRS